MSFIAKVESVSSLTHEKAQEKKNCAIYLGRALQVLKPISILLIDLKVDLNTKVKRVSTLRQRVLILTQRDPVLTQEEAQKKKKYKIYLSRTLEVLQPDLFFQIDLNKLLSLDKIRQLARDNRLGDNYTIDDFRKSLWVNNQSVEGPRVWMRYCPSNNGAIYEFIDPKAKELESCKRIFCRIVIQGEGARFRGFVGPSFPGKLAIQMIWNVMMLTNVRDIALQDLSTHLSCCKDEAAVSLHILHILTHGVSYYVDQGATANVTRYKLRSYLEVEEIDDQYAKALADSEKGSPPIDYDSFATVHLNSLHSSLTKEDAYWQAAEFLANITIEDLCRGWEYHADLFAKNIETAKESLKIFEQYTSYKMEMLKRCEKSIKDIKERIGNVDKVPFEQNVDLYASNTPELVKYTEKNKKDGKSDSEQLMILNKQKKGLLNFIKEGKKIQAYIDKLEKFGKSARECSSYLAETAYILNIAPSTQIGKLITAMKTAAYSKPDHPVYPEFHKKYHDILDMIVGSKSSFLPEYFSDLFQTNSELKPSEKVLAYVFFVLDSFYKQKARLSSSTGSNQDKLEDIRDLYLKVAKPTSNLKTLTQVVYESLVMMVETNGTPVSTKLRLYSSREGRVKWARYNEDIEFRNNEVAQQALTYLSMRTVQELYKNSPKNLQNMLQRLLKSIDVEANENDRLTLLDIFSRLPGNQELEILLKEFMENLLQYCCSCATSLFESYKKGKTPEDTYPLLMLAKYLCKNRELFSFQL